MLSSCLLADVAAALRPLSRAASGVPQGGVRGHVQRAAHLREQRAAGAVQHLGARLS